MKFAFNTICLKEILNIYLEELHVINYYVKNHLMLLKNKKYDGNQRELASVAYNVFIKNVQVVLLKIESWQTSN